MQQITDISIDYFDHNDQSEAFKSIMQVHF